MFQQSSPNVNSLLVVLAWVATISACHERRGPNLTAQDATHVQEHSPFKRHFAFNVR